jgi:hydroxyacylglutathione hydrolase
MIVETLVVGFVQTNCYVIVDEKGRDAAIIDPGGDAERIVSTVLALGQRLKSDLRVGCVINTHANFDHILDNSRLIDQLARLQTIPPRLVAHKQAAPLMATGGGARWFGLPSVPGREPDELVEDGDTISLSGRPFQVLYTPGHSPGSISLYSAADKSVFVGDVIFRQGVGRTDLQGGDWKTLLKSIRDRLLVLPDDTIVYPGHGPATTIGHERQSNPFL